VDAAVFFWVAERGIIEEDAAIERMEEITAAILSAGEDERNALLVEINSRMDREPSEEIRAVLDELRENFQLDVDGAT
jgi:hypothetical protein